MNQLLARQYLLKIISVLEGNKSAILVGGQCLLVWASYYESLGYKNLSVGTRDIDIVGNRDVVRKIEGILNIKPSVPGFDDITPELGVFHVPINDEKLVIDVLGQIAGLTKYELEKYSVIFEFEGKKIRVLNPIGMLRSRVANVVVLRRKDKRSLSQLKSSIKIVNHFLNSLLSMSYSYARKDISNVLKFAGSRDGKRLYRDLDIDILDAIPREHKNYPAEFINRHLRITIEKIEKKR